MKMDITPLRRSLNKAYLKVKPQRTEIEQFKVNFKTLLDRINKDESEENVKTHLRDFLNDTWYKQDHLLATQGRTDLVIHANKTAQSKAAVLFEVKRPKNTGDMITQTNPNAKALHELLLYYLQERIEKKNNDIKHLVITNIYEWYLFDVPTFDKIVYQNKALVKEYENWRDKGKAQSTTDFFYKEIAKPFIENSEATLSCTYFNFKDFETALLNNKDEDDRQLIPLFKVLSPPHLLKQPFTNDSNSLDKGFYNELLHLIGLEEEKEGGKKIIRRKEAGKRNNGSLLENAIATLENTDRLRHVRELQQYGSTRPEQLFGVALELVITWVNRILFLKLLEAQLLKYHRGDKAYCFLNAQKISDFDELNELFFEVLAKQTTNRPDYVRSKFQEVPYLNSSLFEITDLEDKTILISNLKDRFQLPIFGKTVLKDQFGKARSGERPPLHYFFEFLEAYDFASEGAEDIQEDNKRLINASVLGLIFEKINGYKDGSFFTPGFITVYMCRETIRRAIVQKFNDHYGWQCADLDALYNKIDDKAAANALLNSLRICDPAVGSGHFLVSALNEIIAIKSELRILCDRDGKLLRDYQVEVVNDELVVTDEDNNFFEYNPHNRESRRVQETLFREKQTIIENCLFGVDINPNSVKICRLRLWIELLKNAYYRSPNENASPVCYADALELRDEYRSAPGFGELETLPNIDINIKQGNSLISRFALDADLSKALKSIKYDIQAYRGFVRDYHHATDKEEKRGLLLLIDQIKGDFRSEIHKNDPLIKRRSKLSGELYNLTQQTSLFGLDEKAEKDRKKQIAQVEADLNKVADQIAAIQDNRLYENAFEWRFEFPEVLDEQGNFVGFDVVMGNPPYIGIQDIERNEAKVLKENFVTAQNSNFDLYILFLERGIKLLGSNKSLTYINPNKFFTTDNGKLLRRELIINKHLSKIIDFGHLQVFEDASAYTCIVELIKQKQDSINYAKAENFILENLSFIKIDYNQLSDDYWVFKNSKEIKLYDKVFSNSIILNNLSSKISRGSSTGDDKVFLLAENNGIFENGYGDKLEIEKNLLVKPIFSTDFTRYSFRFNHNKYLLFPYEKNGSFSLIEESSLKDRFPKTYDYLQKQKNRLNARKQFKEWFSFSAPRNLDLHSSADILIPLLANKGLFSLNVKEDSSTLMASGGFSLSLYDHRITANVLLALLNSKLLFYFLEKESNKFRGGYITCTKQYIERLPIKIPNFETQKQIESLVTRILAAKQADPTADTRALEAEIDALVYQLYGLTEEEIRIVEGV